MHDAEAGKVRGRDAVLLRDGEQVARVLDLPWEEDDPGHLGRAAAAEGRVVLAGRLGPENVAEAIRACARGRSTPPRELEREPGIKDHDKVRAFVAAAR